MNNFKSHSTTVLHIFSFYFLIPQCVKDSILIQGLRPLLKFGEYWKNHQSICLLSIPTHVIVLFLLFWHQHYFFFSQQEQLQVLCNVWTLSYDTWTHWVWFKLKLKFVTLLSYLYQQNLSQFDMIYWMKNFLARFKSWHFRLSLKKILLRKFRRRVVDEPYQQYLSQFDIYIMINNFWKYLNRDFLV